jgi:cytoskeleton protein RodZ
MVRLNPRSFRVLDQEGGSDKMHSVEGVDHVGAFLREARETTGRSVADVAQILRIRRIYLEAIEDGRFDELPGAAYAVGFVRTYANHLRLDVPEVVARFKEEASGIQAPQELDFPTPVPEGRFPGGIVVTLSLLVAAGVFGGWYWYQDQNAVEVAAVPPPPAGVAPEVAESTPEPTVTEPVTVAAPASASKGSGESVASVEEAEAAVETPDSDVPLVPPSYLRPQIDPLAAMADFEGEPDVPAEAQQGTPEPVGSVSLPQPPEVAAPSASVVSGPPATADSGMTGSAPDSPAGAREDVSVAAAAPAPTPEPAVVQAEEPTAESVTPRVLDDAPGAPPPMASSTGGAVEQPDVRGPETPAAVETRVQVASLPSAPEAPRLETASEAEGRTYGVVNRDARIVIGAEENTWVQVRDSAENVVLTQMLQAGDRYLVPNRAGLRLMTGNAGGLAITVDGEAVPAIGARGEARRDVRLEADLLKNGQAVIR